MHSDKVYNIVWYIILINVLINTFKTIITLKCIDIIIVLSVIIHIVS
jgi:hypothetical protein